MMWRNERYLFRIKSKKSGKEIFSMFPDVCNLTLWEKEEWLSDDWDPCATGMEYDWNRPFFAQFQELMEKAPVPSRGFFRLINSDYSNNASDLKDCYLVFGSVDIENGAYLENSARLKDCLDVSFVSDSQLSYECFSNSRCYNALYSSFCEDCQDILFCRDCTGCSHCFGCVGLRSKSYHIFNQPYPKEEYEKRLQELGIRSYARREEMREHVSDFWNKFPSRSVRSYKNNNCTGEYISNSKNVKDSYFIDGGENMRFCHSVYARPARDCWDQYRYGGNCELMYECGSCGGNSSNIRFSYHVYDNSHNAEYSFSSTGCAHIFGCVGLNKKEYCILNKQYSKEEYEELVPKIIKHMDEVPFLDARGNTYKYGEYFPFDLAPFAYNESVIQEYFPLTKDEAISRGFKWREMERKSFTPTMAGKDIPDSIAETNDDILKQIIGCEHGGQCSHECTRVFRVIPQELQFYKQLNIPIPHLCPNCRYFERITQRAPVDMWVRACDCAGYNSKNGIYANVAVHPHGDQPCPNSFRTSYPPDAPCIVYCEACYQNEVV